MKAKTPILLSTVLLLFVAIAACKKDPSTNTTNNVAVPAIYSKIYGASSITSDGTYVTIKTNDLPDHKVFTGQHQILYTKHSAEQPLAGIPFQKIPIL